MATIAEFRQQIEQDGFCVVREFVPRDLVERLRALCSTPTDLASVSQRGDAVYGIRNLLSGVPQIGEILAAPPFQPFVTAVLGPGATPVTSDD